MKEYEKPQDIPKRISYHTLSKKYPQKYSVPL
jgi:hypothetical protein